MLPKKPRSATQKHQASTGTGLLEVARGQDHVAMSGVVLIGERDIFGRSLDVAAMATTAAQGTTWSGVSWSGTTWSGDAGATGGWQGQTWG
jgi:serine protease AprX